MIEKKYKLARLVDCEGDISKEWYIVFYIWDQDKKTLARKRDYTINSHTNVKDRRARAKQLIGEINELLAAGKYASKTEIKEERIELLTPESMTFYEAVDHAFKTKKKTIKPGTQKGYVSLLTHLKDFLTKTGRMHIRMIDVNSAMVHNFFDYLKEIGLGNKSHNNYRGYLSTIFNFYINREQLSRNPAKSVMMLKVETAMHVPYSNEQTTIIRKEIEKLGDDQFLAYISFLYYTFIRPKELRHLTVGCIKEKTIFIPANISKNGKGEHVVIPAALEKIIVKNKYRSFSGALYLFSLHGTPGEIQIGKNYFYKKNVAVLESLGFENKKHDLYGYKHTGVINLYNACKDMKAVQKQCRHSTIQQTDTYLRDLGLITNEEALNFPEF